MIRTDANFVERAAKYFEALPAVASRALVLAINQTAERGGMKLIKASILAETEFPAGYLDSGPEPSRKLQLVKAYGGHMEAVIRARQRPTSLARFARGGLPGTGKARSGVSVTVNPGSTRFMKTAFLMRLRAGNSVSDSNHNVGLAIRLKPGQTIRNKRVQGVQLDHNLILLYGPSVDQVFRDVAEQDAPEIASMAGDEFIRQFSRLSADL